MPYSPQTPLSVTLMQLLRGMGARRVGERWVAGAGEAAPAEEEVRRVKERAVRRLRGVQVFAEGPPYVLSAAPHAFPRR